MLFPTPVWKPSWETVIKFTYLSIFISTLQLLVTLRQWYTDKYFSQSISWNTYFTIVSLCKLQEKFMIYFLKRFMKYESSENQFSEFPLSWKSFLLNLFSCFIKSFIINDVCKNLKENVNVKIWSKDKVVFRTLKWLFVLKCVFAKELEVFCIVQNQGTLTKLGAL